MQPMSSSKSRLSLMKLIYICIYWSEVNTCGNEFTKTSMLRKLNENVHVNIMFTYELADQVLDMALG